MPIYISLFEPKKKALANGAVALVIALEAPNKRVAESIATGKLYESYPEGGDNFFNAKTVEDQPGQPRPAVGQFDERFAAENVFDGSVWVPKEPEPEFPAGPVDLMSQPANVRITAVVMYGDGEIDNSQLSMAVDFINDEETPDDTGMRAVIDGLVSVANHRSRMKAFREALPDKPVGDFTTKDIAEFLNGYVSQGMAASAKLMRGALLDIFREAVADGIIQNNPVEASRNPKVEVKRSRLLLDEYLTIRNASVKFPGWFRVAMDIALVTGQRISDICNMKWADLVDFRLRIEQEKTGAKITIPVQLSIAGVSLERLIEECWQLSAGREFILVSRKGEKIAQRTMTDYFTKSRRLTSLSWDSDKEPPSFHEIRSLSARLHTDARGGEFAQHLLGHKSAEMTARYQDSRGSEWDDIQI